MAQVWSLSIAADERALERMRMGPFRPGPRGRWLINIRTPEFEALGKSLIENKARRWRRARRPSFAGVRPRLPAALHDCNGLHDTNRKPFMFAGVWDKVAAENRGHERRAQCRRNTGSIQS